MVGVGLRNSRDLGRLIAATIYDTLTGAISVGQGNIALNGVGKVIQIVKLEHSLSAPRQTEIQPFDLPQ